MRLRVIRFIQRLMAFTPYEIRNRQRILPYNTLHALNLVLSYYRSRGETITIVQVGACDGGHTDPLRPFIAQGGTRSILIEPNPVAFALLQKTYQGVPDVTLVQAAIGEKDGEAYLYRVKDGEIRGTRQSPLLGLSSFDRNHLVKMIGQKPGEIEQITVPCRTLAGLIAELGLARIDLLLIDVEGYDAEIVRMALAMPIHPVCIECEHTHLPPKVRTPMFEMLEAQNYLVACDRWNMLALKENALEEWKVGKADSSC